MPEPGGIYGGEFRPEFLEDAEEVNSATAHVQKLCRFLAKSVVERYCILTPSFNERINWIS